MAYRFNGSSDYVRFAAAPLSGYSVGPITMAALFKRASTGTADTLLNLIDTGLTAYRGQLIINGSSQVGFTRGFAGSYEGGSMLANSTSVWYLLVASWAGTGTTPRFHLWNGSSWAHGNGGSSLSGSATVGGTDTLSASSSLGFDWFHGDMVCAGIKKASSTDGQAETLSATAFQAWRDFGFDWLIGFDSSLESGGVLQDQASPGTGDEAAISGTTAVSDPPGWAWTSVVAPVAAFSGTPLSGDAPLNVAFTDASTNTPTAWAWDFGDAATSTSQNPSHTYTVPGTYTVELDASNAGGTDNEAKVGYVVVSEAVTVPEGVLSIAFDDTPMTANPEWTRIDTLTGCAVQEYTIDRGRPTEFDKTDTGTAVVRLVDREGLFDPTNFTSPYNGMILPGKQAAIALQNPVSDEWFTLFRGFIESWHYRLDQTRQYMELELQLVDGFAILARAILEVGEDGALPPFDDFPAPQQEALEELAAGNVLYGETTGTVKDRIDGILEDVGWPDVPMRDVFTGNVQVGPKAYGPGTSALDAIWDAVDAEFPGVANCWMSKEGVFIFRGRQARFRPEVAEYQINERTVGDPSGWELDSDVVPVAELEWSNGQDNLFNAVSATPQWVGTGATIRQLDPELDDVAGQYVSNPASITAYGLRSLTFDQLQTVEGIATGSNSMVETKKFATYYKENYSDPFPRISRMVFKSRRPGNTNGTALWNHLCRAEISDLLTVQTAHPGGGGFLEEQFYVEGLHYTVRPGPPTFPIVELSLDLSPKAAYDTNPFDEDEDPE